jgi:hypothetical protein
MIALAAEQRDRFGQRQADDVGVGADQPLDEGAGEALNRVAAGLAAPFAACQIGVDFTGRQALEPEPGLDHAAPYGSAPGDQRKASEDPMAPAGQEIEARLRLVARFAFRQDAQTDADHCVGGKRQARLKVRNVARDRRRGERLFTSQPFSEPARLFAPARRFVDLGWQDGVGLDADLRKERKPARRRGSQHETEARVRSAALVAPLESQGHLKR